MKYYCSEKIGETRSLTPEGFLLCTDVPIARIGPIEYGADEMQDIEPVDGRVIIERDEQSLFIPETMASFNGKPVICGFHKWVTPETWTSLSVGTIQNTRRGTGDDCDLLIADLLIYDKNAIERIQNGLREISIGYSAGFEQTAAGIGKQRDTFGNHVAIVEEGRAGPRCQIGDENKKGDTQMPEEKAIEQKDEQVSIGILQKIFQMLEGKTPPIPLDATAPAPASKEPENEGDHAPEAAAVLEARLQKIETAIATVAESLAKFLEQEKKEPEHAGEITDKDMGVTDDEVAERAEILTPGDELPCEAAQGDSKPKIKKRAAIEKCLEKVMTADNATSISVKTILGDSAKDLKSAPAHLLTAAFRVGSDIQKRAVNNDDFSGLMFGDVVQTKKEDTRVTGTLMGEMYAKKWGRK